MAGSATPPGAATSPRPSQRRRVHDPHIGLYRQDLWAAAATRCEVWCESRSIAGVIVDLCRELAVDLYPCGGFASITFAYEAAAELLTNGDGRPVELIYIGDYDPAGVLIDRSLEAELRRHLTEGRFTAEEMRAAAEASCFPDNPPAIDLRFSAVGDHARADPRARSADQAEEGKRPPGAARRAHRRGRGAAGGHPQGTAALRDRGRSCLPMPWRSRRWLRKASAITCAAGRRQCRTGTCYDRR